MLEVNSRTSKSDFIFAVIFFCMTAQNGLCLALSETLIAYILSATKANQRLSRCLTWPMEKEKNKGADLFACHVQEGLCLTWSETTNTRFHFCEGPSVILCFAAYVVLQSLRSCAEQFVTTFETLRGFYLRRA